LSDTFNNFHEYEIRWTPDEITWLVDGQVGRTKKKSETWNATTNQWDFPQTPARVQLSIWPGGADTNAPGTISWAGGPIDWDGEDIKTNGYYYTTFGEIEISCFNAPNAPGTNKGVSYTISNVKATNDTVLDGNKPTVLKSFLGTGLNMDTTNPNDPSSTQAQIPGAGNVGPGQNPGGAATGIGSNGDGAGSNDPNRCTAMTFSQNCGGIGNANDGSRLQQQMLGLSVFAVALTMAGLLWL
jgi:beta-glucanase (GH16 family)